MVKVFYCWQSDRNPRICRHFIQACLRDAIKQLQKAMKAPVDTKVEVAPDIMLDHSTEGVPGIPKIADTIAEKIKDCDVFVADVTHVYNYRTADKRKKCGQNGNVLIELGMALAQKSTKRILLVMNNAFGNFYGLPFDLRLHRGPISYDLPDNDDKANKKVVKKQLTADLVTALDLILKEVVNNVLAAKTAASQADFLIHMGRADVRWKDFKRRVVEHDFYDLTHPQIAVVLAGERYHEPDLNGVMGIGLIPISDSSLDLRAIEQNENSKIGPIVGDGYSREPRAGSIVVHNGTRRGAQTHRPRKPTGVLEINDDGSVFRAVLFPIGRTNNAKVIAFEKRQREVFSEVGRLVNWMGQHRITGRILVRAVWTETYHVKLLADHMNHGHLDILIPVESSDITTSNVVLDDPKEDGLTIEAIAKAMHPAFQTIWRNAGVHNDPCVDESGTYKP
jgi:hypothetical protein